jgi:uncharacterized protein YndB with AHSA1/START domain
MAKRHASLVLLSRDHHHGLALALRLRQGPEALLTDGWTHDRQLQARRVRRFAAEELGPHFAAEEEALFPFLRERMPELVPLIVRLLGEHRLLEALVAQLPTDGAAPPSGLPVRIGTLLQRHIRAEERELFAACEGAGLDLEAVGRSIESVRAREVRRRHRALYAEASVVINAPTRAIFARLQEFERYGSWWPPTVQFIPTADVPGVAGVDVSVAGRSVAFRVSEIQPGRFIELATLPGDSDGTMRWEVTDARGGRLVRWELNIDWSGDRLEEIHLDLAQAAHEALEALPARVSGSVERGTHADESPAEA